MDLLYDAWGAITGALNGLSETLGIDFLGWFQSQIIGMLTPALIGGAAGFGLFALSAAIVVPLSLKRIDKLPRIFILIAYFLIGIVTFPTIGALYGAGCGFENIIYKTGYTIEKKLTDTANELLDVTTINAAQKGITDVFSQVDDVLLNTVATLEDSSRDGINALPSLIALHFIAGPARTFHVGVMDIGSFGVNRTIALFIAKLEAMILTPFWQMLWAAIECILIPFAIVVLIFIIYAVLGKREKKKDA